MAVRNDSTYMLRALTLAAKAKGKTSPNPMVGAVIVRSGRVVGEGYHTKAGSDHAEIVALKKAGAKARGATMYVTLEPCCHTGSTGPCTSAIIEAGIRRVVYSVADPDWRVSGKGARALRKGGISVSSGTLKEESSQLNEYYFFSQKAKRPFVILKLAQSLDGCIATNSGDSKWISSAESRRMVHQLRSEVDAVMVGAETVRKDNPKLSVKRVKGRNPKRIVVAGKHRLSVYSRIFSDNKDAKTVVAVTSHWSRAAIAQLRKMNVEIWSLPGRRDGHIDLRPLLRQAHKAGIRSILLEGGSALATSFVQQKLVDKLIFVTAPLVIGEGRRSIGDLGISRIERALRFDRISRFETGGDSIFVGHPVWRR